MVAAFRNELLRAASHSAARVVLLDVRLDELLHERITDGGGGGAAHEETLSDAVAGVPLFLSDSGATTARDQNSTSVVIDAETLAFLEAALYCDCSSPHQEVQCPQQLSHRSASPRRQTGLRLQLPFSATSVIPQLIHQLEARRVKSTRESEGGSPNLFGFACVPVALLGESLSARVAQKAQSVGPQQLRSFDDDLRDRDCLLGTGRDLTRSLALQHQLVVLWPSDPSSDQSSAAALLEAIASLGLHPYPYESADSSTVAEATAAQNIGHGMRLVFTHRFRLPCVHVATANSDKLSVSGCDDCKTVAIELGSVQTAGAADSGGGSGCREFGCLLVHLDSLALHLFGIEDARLLPLFDRVTLHEDASFQSLSTGSSQSAQHQNSGGTLKNGLVSESASAGGGDKRPLIENLTSVRCDLCASRQSCCSTPSAPKLNAAPSLGFSQFRSLRSLTATPTSTSIENAKEEAEDPLGIADWSVRDSLSRFALPFCSCSVMRQMSLSSRVERFEQEWWVRRGEAAACWRSHLLLAIEALCSTTTSSSSQSSMATLDSFRVSNVFLPEPYPDALPDDVNNKLSVGVELHFRSGAREHALHSLALVANHCARLFHLVIR